MEELEEIAKQYAQDLCDLNAENDYGSAKRGFVSGACWMKKVDIDRATGWLKTRLQSYEIEKFKRFMEE